MATADQRVQAHRRKEARMRAWTRTFAVLAVLGVPLSIWAIDWPMNLVAALPLGLVGLYLFFYTR